MSRKRTRRNNISTLQRIESSQSWTAWMNNGCPSISAIKDRAEIKKVKSNRY